ncbi:hypothetical protein ABIE26_000187 [Pedobacter africanus]|uniref:Uncharacterized protein n=1 Tax=Pedobacter africanus TaxID=151894 RepID=A0ACC6KVC4_9SPHI|nr:DUF6266 family protein [Pedobacter africanus]MDR6783325.1 hypothetical protein [Pedobacter africanus]
MAKLIKGILGPIRGKLGPVVGSSWKGIAYLREHNKTKTVKTHRTAAQLANEQKFKFVQQWLVPFHPYLTVGFLKLAIRKTEINAAFSANFQIFTGVYPSIAIDYSRFIISKGDLPELKHPVIALAAPDTIEISWQQNTLYTASFDDQLMLVLYSPELKITDGFIGGVKRSALHYSFQFDQQLIGKELEVYLSITSTDRKRIADSVYMGRVLP